MLLQSRSSHRFEILAAGVDLKEVVVEEQERRTRDPGRHARPKGVLHALFCNSVFHVTEELRHVESELIGRVREPRAELLRGEFCPVCLSGEEQVVHCPEPALRAGRLGGLARQGGLVVNREQGEMAKDEPNVIRMRGS